MDAYERRIIRGIYEAACMGNRRALRILENLTTKRRRRGRCEICDHALYNRQKRFCSVFCQNRAPRTNFTKGPKHRLTPNQEAAIKRDYVAGVGSVAGNIKQLAKQYGMSTDSIRRIARGQYWRVRKKKPSVKTALNC